MKHLKHRLLSDAQRRALIERIHKMHIKRLLIGSTLIAVGTFIPEFHLHVLSIASADAAKAFGYLPFLKIVEEIL